MALLEVNHLTFSFSGAAVSALSDVSFALESGSFTALCGPSGSGKSTLLRLLKPGLSPTGETAGEVRFDGAALQMLSKRQAAEGIGFVGQNPAAQIVTDKVWHELVFGMESLGVPQEEMRLRAAETAAFFGIRDWFHRRTDELSGGQMQLLNLAAVMTLRPKLLLLDEPTAQLDPIAAETFLFALQKVRSELGTAVFICEHRLENVLPLCDKMLVLDSGASLAFGSVPQVGAALTEKEHPFALALPTAMRVHGSVQTALPCPVSVQQGRAFLKEYLPAHPVKPLSEKPPLTRQEGPALAATEVFFRYEKDGPAVLHDFSLQAYPGELLCILGGNGAGKTTALRLLSGALKAQHGDVTATGKIAFLPQDPTLLFLKTRVDAELKSAAPQISEEDYRRVLELCRLEELTDRHPFDLSGGEQQRVALGKLLLQKADILLLDEPTKGFDAAFKAEFSALLSKLKAQGVCIVMVSHDVEFCALYADAGALLFDGGITALSNTRTFFQHNRFYTTAARRMAHDLLPDAVTADDIIESIGGTLPRTRKSAEKAQKPQSAQPKEKTRPLPLWRKIAGAVSALAAAAVLIATLRHGDLQTLTDGVGVTAAGGRQLVFYGVFFALLFLTALLLKKKEPRPSALPRQRQNKKAVLLSVIVAALGVPTLVLGVHYFGTRGFYAIALLLLLEAMLPFFLHFEGRHPPARELVVLASLCALNVAGRAAFFMLPQFKPVLAMTVLVGVALGAERGFLVGAVTMLRSNVLFCQGAWTPWQMFAMGLVGALSGWLSQCGVLHRTRLSLSVFGAIAAVLVYGGILNPASALLWGGEALNFKVLLSYYVTGLPMDLVHAAASFLFLWVLSEPMLAQLERVRGKLLAAR